MYDPGPCVYMEKIAVGPEAKGAISLDASITENLHNVAKAKGEAAAWGAPKARAEGEATREAMAAK